MQKQKTIVLVLGMHRSGTSAVTGVLQLLGLNLGHHLLEGSRNNPKGYFENTSFLQLNRRILADMNASWDNVGQMLTLNPRNANPALKRQLRQLFLANLEENDNFGVKDPRICILLPLYKEVITTLGVTLKCVVTRRNVVEIAASLAARNAFTEEKAYALTEAYMESIGSNLALGEFIELWFDQLLNDTENVIDNKIRTFLPFLAPYTLTREKITAFLDRGLKHY